MLISNSSLLLILMHMHDCVVAKCQPSINWWCAQHVIILIPQRHMKEVNFKDKHIKKMNTPQKIQKLGQ